MSVKEKAKAFEGTVCRLNVVWFAMTLTLGIPEIFGGVFLVCLSVCLSKVSWFVY